MKLPYNTMTDEYLILHEGNHNEMGNPHTQYKKISDEPKIVVLTQAQYTALGTATSNDNILYFITA